MCLGLLKHVVYDSAAPFQKLCKSDQKFQDAPLLISLFEPAGFEPRQEVQELATVPRKIRRDHRITHLTFKIVKPHLR